MSTRSGVGIAHVGESTVKTILKIDSVSELEAVISGFNATKIDRWYNLIGDVWVDGVFSGAGVSEVNTTAELPLVGLLWGSGHEKHKLVNGKLQRARRTL